MKKIPGIILCFALVFCLQSNVSATIYTGSIFTTDENGTLVSSDGWSGASLSWTVDNETNPGYWTYAYEFSAEKPELSHAIIEVSRDFSPNNIISAWAGSNEYCFEVDDPKDYNSNKGNSNPGMPSEGIYGLKWDFTKDPGLTATFTLVSDKAPMWGDFYAKGGQDFVYNSGFGYDPNPTTPIDNENALTSNELGRAWALVPDTGTSVPEPATIFLLGSGLIAVGVFGRRKFKR